MLLGVEITSGCVAWGQIPGSKSRDYLGFFNTAEYAVNSLRHMDLGMYRGHESGEAGVVIEEYRERKLVERLEFTEDGRAVPMRSFV